MLRPPAYLRVYTHQPPPVSAETMKTDMFLCAGMTTELTYNLYKVYSLKSRYIQHYFGIKIYKINEIQLPENLK